MGCGGSRADTIEPRYYESWTRETESTWLTNTDSEIGQAIASNNNQRRISDSGSTSAKQCATTCQGKGEDGRQAAHGSNREKKLVNTGTQCGKPPPHSSGSSSGSKAPHKDENKLRPRKLSFKEAETSKASCSEEKSTADGQ